MAQRNDSAGEVASCVRSIDPVKWPFAGGSKKSRLYIVYIVWARLGRLDAPPVAR
jgi:hypothetical protein